MTNLKIAVYETNAGNLYLTVTTADGAAVWCANGYEYDNTAGRLVSDLRAAQTADIDDMADWECGEMEADMPYDDDGHPDRAALIAERIAQLESMTDNNGVVLVADDGGMYPGKMGGAARREFGIDPDTYYEYNAYVPFSRRMMI